MITKVTAVPPRAAPKSGPIHEAIVTPADSLDIGRDSDLQPMGKPMDTPVPTEEVRLPRFAGLASLCKSRFVASLFLGLNRRPGSRLPDGGNQPGREKHLSDQPRGPECSGHRLRVDCVLARTKCRCSVLVPVRHLASDLANSPDLRDPRHSLRPIHPVGVNLASALLPLRRPHLDDALPS